MTTETADQLRAAGWPEDKIKAALARKAIRDDRARDLCRCGKPRHHVVQKESKSHGSGPGGAKI